MVDRLRAIECFILSVQLGSLSKAARKLGVTPASVSRQVSALEEHCGLRLLNRTTRQLSVTEGGALFFERARSAVDQLVEAEELVRGLQGVPSGLLRITAPASFGRLHVAPWLPRFLASYPLIQLDLLFSDRLIDVLEEKIDVAIRIKAPADSSTICRRLARQHSVTCASPGYLRRFGQPCSIEHLKDHNCLTYGMHSGSVWQFYSDRKVVSSVEVGGSVRARDGDTIYLCTLMDVGISLQPTWRAGEDLKAGRLVALFPEYAVSSIGPATSIDAFYSNRRHLAPKIKLFIDYLVEVFGSPPYWEQAGYPQSSLASPAAPEAEPSSVD